MNSTRTVPVTLELLEQALEYFWRATPAMKINPNEEVKIHLNLSEETLEAKITTTKEVVEVFRI